MIWREAYTVNLHSRVEIHCFYSVQRSSQVLCIVELIFCIDCPEVRRVQGGSYETLMKSERSER
jgi:hypothetical protein